MSRLGRRGGSALVLLFLHLAASSQIKPSNPDSVFSFALQLSREGRNAEALLSVRGLLQEHPDFDDARVLYGRLLAWQDKYPSALTQFDSVLAHSPSHPGARMAKAQVLAWSGRYEQSENLLGRLVREFPETAAYREELGKVYLWDGQASKALTEYQQAYRMDRRSVETLRGLARASLQLRLTADARRWYQDLLVLDPADHEAKGEVARLAYYSTYEVQIQGTYESFLRSGIEAHTIAQLEVYAALTERWKPFLHYSRIAKFGIKDDRFGLGAYITTGRSVSVFVQGIVSPGAAVAPRTDLTAEVEGGIGGGMGVVAGYRYLKFVNADVHVIHPGLTYYASGSLWFAASAYLGYTSLQTSSNAFLFTCSYELMPLTTARLGLFSGNEAFRATTLNELSTVKSLGGFVSLKTAVSEFLVADLRYQYTAHGIPSSAHLVTITLAFLF